jgi:hypothetical protein
MVVTALEQWLDVQMGLVQHPAVDRMVDILDMGFVGELKFLKCRLLVLLENKDQVWESSVASWSRDLDRCLVEVLKGLGGDLPGEVYPEPIVEKTQETNVTDPRNGTQTAAGGTVAPRRELVSAQTQLTTTRRRPTLDLEPWLRIASLWGPQAGERRSNDNQNAFAPRRPRPRPR